MGPFLRKYWQLLVAVLLLFLPVVVYAAHADAPQMPGPLRRAVVLVTSPVQRALVASVEAAQDVWFGYVDLRRVREQDEELRREILRLRGEQARTAELEAENLRLRRMVSFVESQPDVRMVAAPVVGWGADARTRTVRIGRGSADGVRGGMAVVTWEGVVGRVTQVFADAADVQLIIDPHSAVPARSQRTRARATARGMGEADRVRLDYILRSDDIEEGDILVTVPSGGLFPGGLKLGRAVHVSPAARGGLFKSADLVPAVDFNRLDEVLVVVDNGPTASRAQPLSTLPH